MKCACGCGGEVKISQKSPYKPNEFIHGHATKKPMELRFWKRVLKTEGCWLWTGKLNASGYGRISHDAPNQSHVVMAHRYSYELHYGIIPDGLFVCHHCDTPACVRPDHLFLGKQSENMLDMISKKIHPVRKIFLPQLEEIERLYKSGLTISEIGRMVAISRTTVRRILKNPTLPPAVALYENNIAKSNSN